MKANQLERRLAIWAGERRHTHMYSSRESIKNVTAPYGLHACVSKAVFFFFFLRMVWSNATWPGHQVHRNCSSRPKHIRLNSRRPNLKTKVFGIPTSKRGSTLNLVSPYFPVEEQVCFRCSHVRDEHRWTHWKCSKRGSIFDRCTSVSFQRARKVFSQSVKYLLFVWTHEGGDLF